MSKTDNKREQVLKQYLDSLPKHINKVEEMWTHLRHVQWNPQVLSSLKLLTHKLLGGALALRLHKIAYDLKSLDYNINRIADDSGAANFQDTAVIDESIKTLKQTAANLDNHQPEENKSPKKSLVEVGNEKTKLLYVVDDDQIIRDLLASELESSGYRLATFASLQELYDALKTETPALVILDIVFPDEGALAGIDALKHLRSHLSFKVPVIFISARADMVARLRCLRAGGNAFFGKPVDIPTLVEKIEDLTPADLNRHKALLIDDDEVSLALHTSLLESANFEVTKVTNPLNAVRELNRTQPDVLVLDMKMPMCNGLELADILRQDPQFADLPIIFLTGDNSSETRDQAEQIEHSQFLTKPVELAEFLDHALNAARQYSNFKHKKQIHTHSSRGAIKRRHEFIEKLDSLLNQGAPELSQTHLLYIVVDELDSIRNHFGIRNLDKINERILNSLLTVLNPQDLMTAITDGALLALIHGEFQQAWNKAKQISNALSQCHFDTDEFISAKSSIGMFSLNTSITNSIDCVAYAEAAVAQAKENSGNQVVAVLSKQDSNLDKSQQLVLGEKLEKAIKQKDYVLNFQSIAHLNNDQFLAYEVLVRLKDDMGRELAPVNFVETARNLEAIVEMDRWIYTSTTRTMHDNQSKLINARMFLKVSDETLSYRLIPTIVNGLIHESRILGDRQLVFMLNLQTIIKHQEQAVKFANAMREIHCEIAIENYNYKQSFDVIDKIKPGFIKINGDIISQAIKDQGELIDLKAFIKFCEQKNIEIIASQIENETTMEQCKSIGIALFEGFLIDKPSKSLDYPKAVNG